MKQASGAGTVVGSNVKLQGILKDTESIIIHGQLDGEIGSNESIMIAEHALVKGPVTGDVVTIAGNVKGAVEAKSKLEILPTGRVTGSIMAKELIIQSGAIFNGKITMPEDKNAADAKEVKDVFGTKDLYGTTVKEEKKSSDKGTRTTESELEYELE